MFEYLIRDWWQYCFGLALTGFLLLYLAPAAQKAGLVDEPSSRKHHKNSVPLVGGLSIFIAFSLSLLLFDISLQGYRILMFSAGIIMVAGVLDDYLDVPATAKLFVQLIIAIALTVGGGTQVVDLGNILNDQTVKIGGSISIIFSVVAIVGLINAFNLLDGLDGLTGVVASLSLGSLLILYFAASHSYVAEDVIFVLLFLFCVAPFIAFNLEWVVGRSRQVFLGDAGSMLLGLVSVYFLIEWSQRYHLPEEIILSATAAPWLVAMPLMDMVRVMLTRIYSRKPLWQPRRDHVHHVLLDIGLEKHTVLFILGLVQLLFCLVGIIGTISRLPDSILFWGMFPTFLIFVAVISITGRKKLIEEGQSEQEKLIQIQDHNKFNRKSRVDNVSKVQDSEN